MLHSHSNATIYGNGLTNRLKSPYEYLSSHQHKLIRDLSNMAITEHNDNHNTESVIQRDRDSKYFHNLFQPQSQHTIQLLPLPDYHSINDMKFEEISNHGDNPMFHTSYLMETQKALQSLSHRYNETVSFMVDVYIFSPNHDSPNLSESSESSNTDAKSHLIPYVLHHIHTT